MNVIKGLAACLGIFLEAVAWIIATGVIIAGLVVFAGAWI